MYWCVLNLADESSHRPLFIFPQGTGRQQLIDSEALLRKPMAALGGGEIGEKVTIYRSGLRKSRTSYSKGNTKLSAQENDAIE
jgi:hypothetical protein